MNFIISCISQLNRRILMPSTTTPSLKMPSCVEVHTSSVGNEESSIHSASISAIHNVPMNVIQRPIPSVLDEAKVQSLMETIKNEETEENVPPIDILWIKGSQGGNYYYSFGGCHRFEAYKRLQRPTIKAKLVNSTIGDLYHYMGSSAPTNLI